MNTENSNHSDTTASGKWLVITGLLGLFAALVTGIGEYFLLYAPELKHGAENNYMNFLHPTESQLKLGYYLGAIGAPFYLIGYWHIVGMLKQQQKWIGWLIMALAIFGFMSGLVWLLSNAYQGILVQTIAAHTGDTAATLLQVQTKVDQLSAPLLQVIRYQVLAISVLLAFLIFRGGTYYPRWMGLLTPIVLILLVFSTMLYMPSIGKFFVPEALNVAHFVFFALSTLYAKKALERNQLN